MNSSANGLARRLKGLGRNCFFLDHAHGEDKQQRDSSSKTNTYEVRRAQFGAIRFACLPFIMQARMAVDLVVHFIKQGYKPGDIAVLSPYLGQVRWRLGAESHRELTFSLLRR